MRKKSTAQCALGKLGKDYTSDDLDLVYRIGAHSRPTAVFGAAVEVSRMHIWAAENNVVPSRVKSPTGFIGGEIELLLPNERRKEFRSTKGLRLPVDHVQAWRRGTELVCVSLNPYDIFSEHVVGLARLVTEFGLDVRVQQRLAWYYPGLASLVEIWKRGVS